MIGPYRVKFTTPLFGGIFVAVRGIAALPRSVYYSERSDAQAVADWLNEREAGYPSLKKYEGGANWPIRQPGESAGRPLLRTRSG